MRRTYLIALFGRNASKPEEAALQIVRRVPVARVGEADLAPPRLTLLLTKQALSARVHTLPSDSCILRQAYDVFVAWQS